ncbi:MAG TPA: hypothetical protein DCW44_07865 [Eubacterium sp.]|nr:hypothetical protein [Eubacterium sp.]
MRKIHYWGIYIFLCISCSYHEYVDEYEKVVNDSINMRESDNSNKNSENGKAGVRTFSVLGNSISTYSGYIPRGYANYYTSSILSVEDTWWMLLSEKEDLELASNASWAGSSVANKSGKNANSYFTSDMRINALAANGVPDIIFVLGGTNDWGDNSGYLGDYPIDDNYDLKTFRGAYTYLVVQLKKKYPDTSIICCSILPRKQPRTQKNRYGVTQMEIDESINYICNHYNVNFIDMSVCGIEKDINGYTIDGLHPNKAGMTIISDYINTQIKIRSL